VHAEWLDNVWMFAAHGSPRQPETEVVRLRFQQIRSDGERRRVRRMPKHSDSAHCEGADVIYKFFTNHRFGERRRVRRMPKHSDSAHCEGAVVIEMCFFYKSSLRSPEQKIPGSNPARVQDF
jgi:hypothetical protein